MEKWPFSMPSGGAINSEAKSFSLELEGDDLLICVPQGEKT